MSTQPTPTFGGSGAEDITRIPVTGSSPRENYEVLIGHNLLGKIPEILGNRAKKVLVIHPRALRSTGELVMEDLRAMGYESFSAEIPDAEEAKHYQVAAFCWQVLGQNDFTRTDAIVSVGAAPLPTWPASWRRPGCAACALFTFRPPCWHGGRRRGR